MEQLTSDRILLRPMTPADNAEVFAYRSDPELFRYQSWKPATLAEVDAFIARLAPAPDLPGTWRQYCIFHKLDQRIAGDCGLHFLAGEPDQAEIGITVRREYQGQGLAREALTLAFDYLFRLLRKHRIIASIDPANSASRRLMERMGMRQEAHFRKSLFLDGRWADDVIYAILEEEWITQAGK